MNKNIILPLIFASRNKNPPLQTDDWTIVHILVPTTNPSWWTLGGFFESCFLSSKETGSTDGYYIDTSNVGFLETDYSKYYTYGAYPRVWGIAKKSNVYELSHKQNKITSTLVETDLDFNLSSEAGPEMFMFSNAFGTKEVDKTTEQAVDTAAMFFKIFQITGECYIGRPRHVEDGNNVFDPLTTVTMPDGSSKQFNAIVTVGIKKSNLFAFSTSHAGNSLKDKIYFIQDLTSTPEELYALYKQKQTKTDFSKDYLMGSMVDNQYDIIFKGGTGIPLKA